MQTRPFGELADGRTNNYDFLRFLFAAFVIFAHSFYFIGRGVDPISWASLNGTYSGDIAVDGFFAISGCLVTASWLRSRGLVDYFKKRILRIYPGFIVAALICLLIVGPLGTANIGRYFHTVRWLHALIDIALLNKIQHVQAYLFHGADGELNGPMWSIKIEFECYIMVAALGLLALFRRRGLILTGFLMAHAAYFLLAPQQHYFANAGRYFDHFRCLTFFLAGMCFYLYRDAIPRTWKLCVVSIAAIAVFTALHRVDMGLPIFGGYLLFYAAYNSKWRLEKWGEKHDLSYGLYVYGWPVQLLLITYVWPHVDGPAFRVLASALGHAHARSVAAYGEGYVFFAASFLLAAVCAAISWHFVESPALRLKSRSKSAMPMPGLVDQSEPVAHVDDAAPVTVAPAA